jgi:hypothetical protein
MNIRYNVYEHRLIYASPPLRPMTHSVVLVLPQRAALPMHASTQTPYQYPSIKPDADAISIAVSCGNLLPIVRNSVHLPHLLSLAGIGELLLAPPLARLSASLGIEHRVPPPEAAGVVSNELLVVDIVVLGAGPEGQEVVQAPWELVAAVRIDGLGETDGDPDVHCQDVEVLGDGAPDDGAADSAQTEDHDLDWRRVLSCQAERSRVLVVDLVDLLVQKGALVHHAMHPVVPCVLIDEKDCDLVGHLVDAGERDRGFETEVLTHGVEEPDLRKLDSEVGEEDEDGALCLFPGGGNLVLRGINHRHDIARNATSHTCWILYFLKYEIRSIMIQGKDRPK